MYDKYNVNNLPDSVRFFNFRSIKIPQGHKKDKALKE